MHKIIADIASIAHVASGFLDNSIAIAIAHNARSERGLILNGVTYKIDHAGVRGDGTVPPAKISFSLTVKFCALAYAEEQ